MPLLKLKSRGGSGSTQNDDFEDDNFIEESKANNSHMHAYIQEILDSREEDVITTSTTSVSTVGNKYNSFPREVQLWFYLWRLYDINTVDQTFSILVTLSATWIEDNPNKNFRLNSYPDDPRWTLSDFAWHPQLRFLNIIEEDDNSREDWFTVQPINDDVDDGFGNKNKKNKNLRKSTNSARETIKREEWYDNYKVSNASMKVTQFIKTKIVLSEAMELKNFPFDIQPLHFQISSSWDCEKVLLTFHKSAACAMDPNMYDKSSQEWEIHSPRLIAYDTEWRPDDMPLLSYSSQSITGVRYSKAYIALTAMRKPQYYLWNIYVMLFVLGTLSFTVFSIPIEETGDRLSNMLTLVLALVAFKLVLAQALPAISYLTMLDVYTLASLMIMFFISISTSLIPSLGLSEKATEDGDLALVIISALVWVFVNVWFVTKLTVQNRKVRMEVEQINDTFATYRNTVSKKSIVYGYRAQ